MKINIEGIVEKLDHGDIAKIAKKTGLSKMTVSRHLNGKVRVPSSRIIYEAIKIIKNKEKYIQKLNRKIDSIDDINVNINVN